MFYVYVLQNPQEVLYKGQTDDLNRRISEHNDLEGPVSYTRGKGPWVLVYKEEYSTRAQAMKREKFFKTGKGRETLQEILSKKNASH